jgi:hypothetical protein
MTYLLDWVIKDIPIWYSSKRFLDYGQSGLWSYLDLPRQHPGYARFGNRFAPIN